MTYLHLKREKARLKKIRKMKQPKRTPINNPPLEEDYTIPASDWMNK